MRPRRAGRLIGLVTVLATLCVVLAGAAGAWRGLDRHALDAAFDLRGTSKPSGIVVVGIDTKTLTGGKLTWPLRRRLHAQMIDRLREVGARQIVYDVQFTEPSSFPDDDLALVDAVGRTPGMILATVESDARGRTQVLGGDDVLRDLRVRAASASFPPAPGGVVRRYSREDGGGLPSIATAVAEEIGRPLARSDFNGAGNALIDFRGPAGTFQTYSFGDVLARRVPASRLRDQIVVVGATAPSLLDYQATSAPGSLRLSGPEVQANTIWTAINGNPLRVPGRWVSLLAAALLGLLSGLLLWRTSIVRAVVLGVLLLGAVAGATFALFTAGVALAPTAPLLAIVAVLLAGSVVVASQEAIERSYLRRYGSELEQQVAERTQELADAQLELVLRLARAAELRDDDTGEHIDRMSELCGEVARELGMPDAEAEQLRHASALHDIGKLGVPDEVLLKPGKLTPEEFDVMREHVVGGAELLEGSTSPLLQLAEEVTRTHHEKWDGSGYPAGLKGAEIPLSGRIAAVCDVFDALTHRRPYKEAWPLDEALAEIQRTSGAHFDPAVADALLAVIARREAGGQGAT